jgi:Domain of unknown function (DUF6894)
MPKFYFNLQSERAVLDKEGEYLPSLVDAMQEAVTVAKELARNKEQDEVAGNEVVVTDPTGEEVFRMPLIRV